MKSLILKDILNISHNAKAMLLMLLLFAVLFIPQSGPSVYVVMCGVLCSAMIITTFSFDDMCKWDRYALVTPVTTKTLAAAKFWTLLLFDAVGIAAGVVIGVAGATLLGKFRIDDPAEWLTVAGSAAAGLGVSFFFGSLSIPLIYKFGAEKARLMTLAAYALPALIIIGVIKLLTLLQIPVTKQSAAALIAAAPILLILFGFAMYKLSCRICRKKEY